MKGITALPVGLGLYITYPQKEWHQWMEDLDKKLLSLMVTKTHLAAPLSGSFVPEWVKWDLEALDKADTTKRTDLEEFLLEQGILAHVRLIQPLKYDLCEIWVENDQRNKIRLLFAGKIYAPFDKESDLVRVCGSKESFRIVLVSYENITRTWTGQNMLVKDRIKQLEAPHERIGDP